MLHLDSTLSTVEDCSHVTLKLTPDFANLLENKRTSLIRAHMRQNVLESARGSQPIIASSLHSGWPIRSRQRLPYIVRLGALEDTQLPLSAFGVALHLLVRRLSHPTVPSSLLYTYVLVTVNTQSISNQHFPLLSSWGTASFRDDLRILPGISVPRYISWQSAK